MLGWAVHGDGRLYFRAESQSVAPLSADHCGLVRTGGFYAWGRTHRRLDFLCIVLLFAGVCALLAHDTVIPVSAPIGRILADFSLALYVTHWTVRMIIPYRMNGGSYLEMLPPYLLVSVLYAAVLVLLVRAGRRIIQIVRHRLNQR